jgi:hypothetical protein
VNCFEEDEGHKWHTYHTNESPIEGEDVLGIKAIEYSLLELFNTNSAVFQ